MFDGSELENLFNSIESPNVLKIGEMIEKGMFILEGIKLRNISDFEVENCTFKNMYYNMKNFTHSKDLISITILYVVKIIVIFIFDYYMV